MFDCVMPTKMLEMGCCYLRRYHQYSDEKWKNDFSQLILNLGGHLDLSIQKLIYDI